MNAPGLTGPQLVQALSTLANPHRLRVVATLAAGRSYVSELARELGISRALLQVHLRKLEAAGLVTAQLELSEDGKAMKFYENTAFSFHLTPAEIARVAPFLVPESGPTGKSPPTAAESDDETTERDNNNGSKGAPS
ncbi:MAG TPA: metalloregulator ArsR/SmtB family transcription factor [Mycobacteriales bacterium]|nr:metalloregulator ArsR/SmtB family transcription factor [Mycobacteriales bacterium]